MNTKACIAIENLLLQTITRAIIMLATNGWHFWYFGWSCLYHQCLNDVVGFVSIL